MKSTSKQISGERHFNSGSWLTLLAVIGFLLVVLGSTYYVLRMPGDGWQISNSIEPQPWPLVNYLGDWPTPLQVQDYVLSVEGINVADDNQLAPLQPPPGWDNGGTVRYTLQRAGQYYATDVNLQRLKPREILRGLWYTMKDTPVEWSWFLISLLVFLLRPGNPAARLLLVIGATHNTVTKLGWASTTVSASFAPAAIYYLQIFIGFFWGLIFFPAIIMLALSFPLPIYPLTRWPRRIPLLLFGLPLVFTLIMLASQELMIANLILLSEGILMFAAFGAAFYNALWRSRDPVARAQTLWVIFGFAVSMGSILSVFLLTSSGLVETSQIEWINAPLSNIFLIIMPISLAIAILRYRLFDIDVIIRKTLVYSTLTFLLAMVYFGLVVFLQQLIGAITNSENSPFAIIISTLAIAALFNPLRIRLQNFIDRRFYRRKYNAERALAEFASLSQAETDIETLTSQLVGIVDKTMQPEQLNLWLTHQHKER